MSFVSKTAVASSVPFDNTTVGAAGILSTDVQGALEEVNSLVNTSAKYVTASSIVKSFVSSSAVLMSGMTLTPASGTHIVDFNGQYSSTIGSVTAQAAVDLSSAISAIKALTPTVTGHAADFGQAGGETLTAGVYSIVGAGSVHSSLILDGQNNTSALFVFSFTGALAIAASTSITLINGANASNVFFVADGAFSIGAGSNLSGNFFCNGAAVAIGAGSTISGRAATTQGALSLNSSVITKPSVSNIIALGSLDTFALFTSAGAVANTATSNITGDIGTNQGTISGFETSTVNGNLYVPTTLTSAVNFSIFVNGVLVPNSERSITKTSDVDGDNVCLLTPAVIVAGQSLEVRMRVTMGTVTIGNRVLTALRVGP